MFLSLLNRNEKLAFLALARKVIISDRVVAEQEKVLYNAMQKEVEILQEIVDEEFTDEMIDNLPEDIPELCQQFSSHRAKISALMELIGLAFVDGKFVPEEREIITHIARELGVKAVDLESYIAWAARLHQSKA